MGSLFCYEVDEWRFFKCNESPKERYLEGKGYLYFDTDHVTWSQDLCSLIDAINENSFCDSSATSIEDTFREIQDDIFNTVGEPGKTVPWQTAVFWVKQMIKICASRVQPGLNWSIFGIS